MSFQFTVKEFIIGNGTPTLQFYKKGFDLSGSGSQPSWQDIILSGNTALTLTNALADGLNYVKLFGGTEQRNLPVGFTQVEYIESSGTQYIDTGINDITNSEFEVVAQQTSITGAFPTIMGALDSDSNYKVICGLSTSNNTFYSQCGGPNGFIVSSVPNDTQKHTFKVTTTTNQQTLQIDDTAVVIGNYAITSTTGYPLTICARNKDTVSNFTNQKVFSVRIKKSGTLVCNLIPCRRNSDNVLGMYDTVTGNFLTNAGTGTFTAGAEVVPTPDTPMDIVSNNGVIKAFKTLNISTYDTSATGAGIDIAFDGTTDRRRWDTLNDGGTGTRHYENGFVSIYMGQNGNTYYAKALANGVVYGGSVYNTGKQIYSWNYNIDKNIDIYCPAINTDGTTETVEITGKNLFDISTSVLGGLTGTDGSETTTTTRARTDFIGINSSKITVSIDANDNYGIINSYYYDENKNYIDDVGPTGAGTPKNGTFTVPNGSKYVRVTFSNYNSISTNINLDTFKQSKIQIELGSTATTYEPYTVLGTATAENLFKVGTYQDVQSVIDGGVTRNIGIKVLDGTENWNYYATQTMCYINTNLDMTSDYQNASCMCTHFKNVSYSQGTATPYQDLVCFPSSTNFGIVCFRNIAFTTADDFKNYFAQQYANGTPVILLYQKNTATEETVTGQALTTQAGNNTISIVQASIDNLGLEVSYKATV